MKIRIKVTKEVLEKSKFSPCESTACAIATAVRELFPLAKVYSVAIDLLGTSEALNRIPSDCCVSLRNDARAFITRFDCCNTAEERASLPEFSFDIDVPSEVIEKIGLNEVYKILSESKTLEHVNPTIKVLETIDIGH